MSTKPQAVNAAQKVNAAAMLVDMETQRKAWEMATKRVSTTELYSLLAECLRFCNLFKDKNCDKLLAKFYAERNLTFKAKAKLTTKVIHAVFGEVDRRRVSAYAIVVNNMLRDNVTYNNVAKWIADNGGINAIKNANSAKFTKGAAHCKSNKMVDKIKLVTDFIKCKQLAVIHDEQLISAITVDDMNITDAGANSTCVLIADINADGQLAVRALVQQETAIDAVLMAYYDDNKATFETTTASAEVEVNDEDDIEVDDWFYTEILAEDVADIADRRN